MWWNHYSWSSDYWPMPWMFFGPIMMVLFMAVCVAILVLVFRGAGFHRHHALGGGMMSCREMGLGPSLERVAARGASDGDHAGINGSAAFDEYRAETLRRLELEQDQFQEFVEHLRLAKDKAEFDQFITARRAPPSPSAAGTAPPAPTG
jgi:uncharacterized protein DUF2852